MTEDGWRGWWGDEPPFGTPVIVLTHHEREPLAFDNGTVFHFLDADPAEALGVATEMAGAWTCASAGARRACGSSWPRT